MKIRHILNGHDRTEVAEFHGKFVLKVKPYPGLLNPLSWIIPRVAYYSGRDGTLAFHGGGGASGTAPIEEVLDNPANYQFADRAEAEAFLADRVSHGEQRAAAMKALLRS